MSRSEKMAKRSKAVHKLGNQLSVLSRTATKKQSKAIAQMLELYETL